MCKLNVFRRMNEKWGWRILIILLPLAQACGSKSTEESLSRLEERYPNFVKKCVSPNENDQKIIDYFAHKRLSAPLDMEQKSKCVLVGKALRDMGKLDLEMSDVNIGILSEFPFIEVDLSASTNLSGLVSSMNSILKFKNTQGQRRLQRIVLSLDLDSVLEKGEMRDWYLSSRKEGVRVYPKSGFYVPRSVFFKVGPASGHKGIVINIQGDWSIEDGSKVNLAKSDDRSDQEWLFVQRGELYEIRSKFNRKSLTLSGDNSLEISTFDSKDNQLWKVTELDNGVSIASAKNGKLLTVDSDGNLFAGDKSSSIQTWTLIPSNDDTDEPKGVPNFAEDAEWAFKENEGWQKYDYVPGRKHFAHGYESSVSELTSNNKRYVIKEPNIYRKDRNWVIAGLVQEYEKRAPLWRKYELIPTDFEILLNHDRSGLIKSFVKGQDFFKLQYDDNFFKATSVPRKKLVQLFCRLLDKKVWVGDLHQENLIYADDTQEWIVIDTSDIKENINVSKKELWENYYIKGDGNEKQGLNQKWWTHRCKYEERTTKKQECDDRWKKRLKPFLENELLTECP